MPGYKSPLEGYENAETLPTTVNADGKSLYNPPGPRSVAYEEFEKPIDPSNNGLIFTVRCTRLPHHLQLVFTLSYSILHVQRA